LLPAFDHRSSLERVSGIEARDDASSRAEPKSGAASTAESTNTATEDSRRDPAILATPPR